MRHSQYTESPVIDTAADVWVCGITIRGFRTARQPDIVQEGKFRGLIVAIGHHHVRHPTPHSSDTHTHTCDSTSFLLLSLAADCCSHSISPCVLFGNIFSTHGMETRGLATRSNQADVPLMRADAPKFMAPTPPGVDGVELRQVDELAQDQAVRRLREEGLGERVHGQSWPHDLGEARRGETRRDETRR